MTIDSSAFDSHITAWNEWQLAPWGRLRYSIANANLHRHIQGHALQILDVGGGNGSESLPFAAQGHRVTIVDYSTEMLAQARQAVEASDLADYITLRRADIAALSVLFPESTFDLVLCHNVLQYVDAPRMIVESIGRLLTPGGLLSIICPNPASEAYRLAFQRQDLAGAYQQLDATTAWTNMFGVTVQRYTAEEVQSWIQGAWCHMLGQYGIRCLCDYVPDNEKKTDPGFFADLERLEYAMSNRYPYYLLARFMHLIARRGDDMLPNEP